jgi:hypothetical protein
MAIASLFFAASSCSDDLDEEANQTQPTEKAYISVTISSPTDGTRAVGDSENPFVVGSVAEHEVKRADFYFFNKNGGFISHTNLGAITGDDGTAGASTENIEFKGQTAVLVNEFNKMNPPAFVMTILNLPKSIEDPEDYDDLHEYLTYAVEDASSTNIELQASKVPDVYKSSHGFIMSTSSYTASDRAHYDVTYLTEGDFKNSKEEAEKTETPVKIYVERLAAKVALDFTSLTAADLDNGEKGYQIGTGNMTINTLADDGTTITAVEQPLYAQILGWGINGQPARSNIFKHLNTSKTNTDLNFVWNDATNFRSYWGESFNYGSIDGSPVDHGDVTGVTYYYYPKYESNYIDATKVTRAAEALEEASGASSTADLYHLVYLKRNELTTAVGDPAYCPENTNSADVLQQVDNYQGAVSCVLLNAKVVNKVGVGQDIISYSKKLYTRTAFMQGVLAAADVTAFNQNGKPMSSDDLEIVDNEYLNGHINVAVKSSSNTWYSSKDTQTDATKLSVDDINEELAEITPDENPAVIYNEGAMYYSIPIEHLRNDAPTKDSIVNKNAKILEGQFGVVRNHIYQLGITAILNLGHGINHDDEPIVPPLEKDEKYYIGVKVNVLSWKVVSQNVTL